MDAGFNGQDWYRWKDRYKGQLNTLDDAYVAIDTMLSSLNDDYTRFLKPGEMGEQSLSIDARLFGVGIQIANKDNQVVVVAPIEDTPAALAGLQPQDIITHINQAPTQGMDIEKAAELIRGPEGSSVTLQILRKQKSFSVSLNRAEIKLRSVFTRPVKPNNIGYIRLSSFISETTLQEMDAAVRKFSDKDALIIDLRGNYGGLLNNAVDIADLFLDKGVIVSMENRQHENMAMKATPGVIFKKPLVVLIDGGSASASEILSGALKDHQRATLVGAQTFGKGLVQKINPLPEGTGINITISKYFTPNGTDIDHIGIRPDKSVPFTEADFRANQDPQLDAAIALLQTRLPH